MSNKEVNIGELNQVVGGAAASNSTGRIYVVKNGDTLWDIAEKYYKDGTKWQKIYDANKGVIGSNPDMIQVGMKLLIP